MQRETDKKRGVGGGDRKINRETKRQRATEMETEREMRGGAEHEKPAREVGGHQF